MFVIVGEIYAFSVWGTYDVIRGNDDSRVLEGPDVFQRIAFDAGSKELNDRVRANFSWVC